jgi:hypothetical protein
LGENWRNISFHCAELQDFSKKHSPKELAKMPKWLEICLVEGVSGTALLTIGEIAAQAEERKGQAIERKQEAASKAQEKLARNHQDDANSATGSDHEMQEKKHHEPVKKQKRVDSSGKVPKKKMWSRVDIHKEGTDPKPMTRKGKTPPYVEISDEEESRETIGKV